MTRRRPPPNHLTRPTEQERGWVTILGSWIIGSGTVAIVIIGLLIWAALSGG